MITEQELEKALDPEATGTVNWHVLQKIQDILKGKIKGPITVGETILEWMRKADFWDTNTMKVLKKLFGDDEKDDPKKIKLVENIVDKLLKGKKEASLISLSYPIRKISESLCRNEFKESYFRTF